MTINLPSMVYRQNGKSGLCFITMQINKVMGKNLRRLRKGAGLTQEELAEKLNIQSSGLIPRWESGSKGIGKSVITRLCEVFGVKFHDFFIEEDTPIVQDETEKSTLHILREAKKLGVAEEIPKYGRFLVQETKKVSAISSKGRAIRYKAGGG